MRATADPRARRSLTYRYFELLQADQYAAARARAATPPLALQTAMLVYVGKLGGRVLLVHRAPQGMVGWVFLKRFCKKTRSLYWESGPYRSNALCDISHGHSSPSIASQIALRAARPASLSAARRKLISRT